MATQAGTIHKNKSDFQWMLMGTSYEVQLSPHPILNLKGNDVGSLGNRLFNFNTIGKEMFTTEVATVALVVANGDYHIDYTNGVFTGIPAIAGYAKVWYQTKEIAVQ